MNKNIVLIGMPCSGKTTIGSIISSKLGVEFYDSDIFIETKYNSSITDIFKHGEDYFRNIEHETIKYLSTLNNCVISTGGGVILKEKNIKYLKETGAIFFLDRSIDNLLLSFSTSNRPLAKSLNDVKDLYNSRINLYRKYSDYKIDCNSTPLEISYNILNIIKEDSL